MTFRSNPFSLSKVIENSSWLSQIQSTLTLCKMKNETSFEIKAYLKDVSVAQIYNDFLKVEEVVQLSRPPYSPDPHFGYT